jgi:hypothetical protein
MSKDYRRVARRAWADTLKREPDPIDEELLCRPPPQGTGWYAVVKWAMPRWQDRVLYLAVLAGLIVVVVGLIAFIAWFVQQ